MKKAKQIHSWKAFRCRLLLLVVAIGAPFCWAAYTELSVQTADKAGIVPTRSECDATNGNKFLNDGQTFLLLATDSSDTATVTLITQATYNGYAVADQITTLTAGASELVVGPLAQSTFNVTSGADEGYVYLTFGDDGAASVTVAVIKLWGQ